MLRWLLGICGRLFRQTDHESGVIVTEGFDVEAMIAGAVARASAPVVRPDFRLAARIASSRSLNVPSSRAPEPKRRISSTKPTPKLIEVKPKAAPRRRSVVLVGRAATPVAVMDGHNDLRRAA